MAKSTTTSTPEAATAAPADSPAIVTVRITKCGVHAGGFILGKGAIVRLPQAEAAGLVTAGSAIALNQ